MEFFNQSLKRLAKASTYGFEALKQECESECKKHNSLWPIIPSEEYNYEKFDYDIYSKSILPPDLQDIYSPVMCTGDGNCLYRYDAL